MKKATQKSKKSSKPAQGKMHDGAKRKKQDQVKKLEEEIERLRLKEAEWAKSEPIREALMNAPGVFIGIIDLDGKVIDINDANAARLGRKRETTIGQCIWDLFPPDIAAARKQHFEMIVRSGKPGGFIDMRDGLAYEFQGCPLIDEHGGISGAVYFARDITLVKQQENKIYESMQRFRISFFEMSPDAMLIANSKTGKIIDVNRKAESLFEKTSSELIGLHFSDLHQETEKERSLEIFRFFSNGDSIGKENYFFEIDFVNASGKSVPVEATAREIMIQGEKHLLGIFHDIGEKRKIQRDLFFNRQKYKELFDNARIGLCQFTISDGTLLTCNRQMAEILGYSSVEECMDTFTIQKHYANPNDCERLLALLKKKGATNDLEIQIRRRDGSILWGNCSIRTDWKNDSIEGSVSDITAKKLADEKLRESQALLEAVFEGITDPLIMLDSNLSINIMNRAAYRYCDISLENPVKGLCYELKWKRTEPCEGCCIIEALKKGEVCQFEQKSRHHPDRMEAITVYPFSFNDGAAKSGTIVRIQDITEKKKVEDQLIRADRLASMGQFSAGIAHEIRNPLASINLFVEILGDADKFTRGSDELEFLREIKVNVERIDMIVKKVLNLTRQELKEPKQIEIQKVVNSSIKMIEDRLNKSDIRLVYEIPPDLPTVMGDVIQLEQVFTNLLMNAMDAMDKRGELHVAAKQDVSTILHNRSVIRIRISDTGTGVSPEIKDRIFDPFFTSKPSGTGLGLSISQKIIERHGGTIHFENHAGGGALFEIVLPVQG